MLTVHQISKSYGPQTVLAQVRFSLNAGERLALIGPNGSGKTTLLRILAGEMAPDSGSVQFNPPGLTLGYLPQGLAPEPHETLKTWLDAGPDLPELYAQLETLAARLAANPHESALQRRYDAVLARIEETHRRGPLDTARQAAILSALALDHFPPVTPVSHLSGGQKTRLALARVLQAAPQLLLLDEPTNHLDLEMLAWLENWLVDFSGAALVVSHDRAFLDRVASGILELDELSHQARKYAGNYSDYLAQKAAERERHWQSYLQQQQEIVRLQAAVRRVEDNTRFKRGGKGDTGDKFAKGFFAGRSAVALSRSRQIERRVDRLLGEEHIEKPRPTWQMKLDFGDTPPSGREVVWLQDLTVGYPGLELLRGLNLTIQHGDRLAFLGRNGAGKTTLLRTIAGKIPPLAGSLRLGSGVRVGYMAQEQENVLTAATPFELARSLAPFSETEVRAFLHQYLFTGDEVFTPVENLSYGERARLALAALVAQGCNFLLLDEPINHLDIPSRARFEEALAGFEGTVLAVVHDRYFVANFAAQVWQVEDDGVTRLWL